LSNRIDRKRPLSKDIEDRVCEKITVLYHEKKSQGPSDHSGHLSAIEDADFLTFERYEKCSRLIGKK
jgi:hypothetical protein